MSDIKKVADQKEVIAESPSSALLEQLKSLNEKKSLEVKKLEAQVIAQMRLNKTFKKDYHKEMATIMLFIAALIFHSFVNYDN